MSNYFLKILFCLLLGFSSSIFAQEICDNGIDDDADGLIDLNDDDCACDNVFESVIPNPSFEEINCCPSGLGDLNCANGWLQANQRSVDFFHDCGFSSPVFPLPLPEGDGAIGCLFNDGWLEFVGSCLNSPLLAGANYTLEMGVAGNGRDGALSVSCDISSIPPTDIIIYGLPTCAAFPLPTNGCPTDFDNNWIVLGSINYKLVNTWVNYSITFTPTVDINSIAIGPGCSLPPIFTSSGCRPYVMFDDLQLQYSNSVTSTGSICRNNLEINAYPDSITNTYQWFLNGIAIVGETSTTLKTYNHGSSSGTYTFRQSFSMNRCLKTNFVVDPPDFPTVSIFCNDRYLCKPEETQFYNFSTPSLIDSSFWSFGDGDSSLELNPTHTYTTTDSFDIWLKVISPDGCVAELSIEKYVYVKDFDQIIFNIDTNKACISTPINFTNSTPLSNVCNWNFGDNITSNNCTTSHQYDSAGIYDVTLSVRNNYGCTKDTTINAAISILPYPSVDFTVDIDSGCYPIQSIFTYLGDTLDLISSSWDLGNGSTPTQFGSIIHLFDTVGSYDISLTNVSTSNCSYTYTDSALINVFGYPEVLFSVDTHLGCFPVSIYFQNETDSAYTNKCFWNFGDLSTSNRCNTLHTFNKAGTYHTSLRIISSHNCWSDTIKLNNIEIYDVPKAGFEFSPEIIDCIQAEIYVNNTSSLGLSALDWSVSLNEFIYSSNESDPIIKFPDTKGSYQLNLLVTDTNGCRDSTMQDVVVKCSSLFIVPNTFTPNSDVINDVLYPVHLGINLEGYEFSIYNRFGQQIFKTSDLEVGWDGKYKERLVEEGVYSWLIKAYSDWDNQIYYQTGEVNVLK